MPIPEGKDFKIPKFNIYYSTVVQFRPGRLDLGENVSGVTENKPVSDLTLFFRLTRVQFIPLIILPVLLGTSFAYANYHALDLTYLALTVLGAVLLHLGANAVDDAYDFQNGVDKVANEMFPKDFGGWKPIPRGYVTLKNAKIISLVLFVLSLAIAAFFWHTVGIWSFILGAAGVILAIIYCAPPLKLDYRGLGLGELAIFLAFGPIPTLGAFYVQTGMLTLQALLVAIPVGMMTVTILIDHDLIFYEVYRESAKISLGTVLGRAGSLKASLVLTLASYGMVVVLVASKILPLFCLLAPVISAIVLSRKAGTYREPNQPPPHYAPFTVNGLFSNWTFALVLALTALL